PCCNLGTDADQRSSASVVRFAFPQREGLIRLNTIEGQIAPVSLRKGCNRIRSCLLRRFGKIDHCQPWGMKGPLCSACDLIPASSQKSRMQESNLPKKRGHRSLGDTGPEEPVSTAFHPMLEAAR